MQSADIAVSQWLLLTPDRTFAALPNDVVDAAGTVNALAAYKLTGGLVDGMQVLSADTTRGETNRELRGSRDEWTVGRVEGSKTEHLDGGNVAGHGVNGGVMKSKAVG